VYQEIDGRTNGILKNYIELLDNTKLEIPHKRQTLKNFVYFKGLIELLPDIENKVNDSLETLKNGDLS
jgi:7,8-dihydro-6-hydroxymethylpterin-pyrophosphokinase